MLGSLVGAVAASHRAPTQRLPTLISGGGGESKTETLAGAMSVSTPEKLGDGLGDHREALCARAGQKCNIKCKLVHYREELCAEIAQF